MSFLELYLLTRLDAVFMLSMTMAIISAVGVVVALFIMSEAYDDEDKAFATRWLRRSIISTVVAIIITALVPTQKDAIVIYGMHWATNNVDVKNIPDDAVRVIREWINEASPKSDTTLTTTGGKP